MSRDSKPEHKLFIGLPSHDGKVCAQTLSSLISLRDHMPYMFSMICGNPNLSAVRNYIMNQFLATDCTHYLSLDADIGFQAKTLPMMLAGNHDVLAAPYRCKGQDYVFNVRMGQNQVQFPGPFPVEAAALGFMLIKRRVFEKIAENTTTYYDKESPDQFIYDFCHPEFKKNQDGKKNLPCESYMFSYNVTDNGFTIMLDPRIPLSHIGQMNTLTGCYYCTADPKQEKHTCPKYT